MKRKLIALFVSALLLTSFSNSFGQKIDSINSGKSLFAAKVFPVKLYTALLDKQIPDNITLKIEGINSVIPYSTTFTRFVSIAGDTTLYQLPGMYRVTWLNGGANLQNPKFMNTTLVNNWVSNGNGKMEFIYLVKYEDGVCGSKEQLDVFLYDKNIVPLKYKWTPSRGLNNDTIPNPVALLNGNITYKVAITTKDSVYNDSVPLMQGVLKLELGLDRKITCGSSIIFDFINTNYNGSGTLRYKWTPSTGLNNDTIRNPTCTINKDMTYRLSITSAEGCTVSDELKVIFTKTNAPVIGIVSVNNKNQNLIAWNKPASTIAVKYRIYKEKNITNVFEQIGEWSFDSISVFVDTTSNADTKSAKYKLSIVDKCGVETDMSLNHKTMHLSINKGQGNKWNLIWEPYEGFTVSTYNIYRGTSINNLSFLDAVSGTSTQFSDLSAPIRDVFYQLEVISPTLVIPSKAPLAIQKSNNSTTNSLISYNSSRSNLAAGIVSGINVLLGENDKIKVYPNPFNNELRIDLEGSSAIKIFNLMGQVVYDSYFTNNKIINTSTLASGVYLMRFEIENSFKFQKIIKE